MKYLKIYEDFDKSITPSVNVYNNNYNEMDGDYVGYKELTIKVELDSKMLCWASVLLDVKVEDFLTKDGSNIIEINKIESEYLDEKSIYIKRIFTNDDQKNKGYATKVLEEINNICIENNYDFITLDSMPESLDFWIKKGFKIYNNIKYSSNDDSITYYNMIKKI